MEAARLGLHDYQLGGLRPGLGLEPWLTGPPLSTLSHALPGFLAHPQTPYASYLPTNVSSPLGLPGLVTMSSCFPASLTSPPTASTASSPAAAPVSPAASDGRISPGGRLTSSSSSSHLLSLAGCDSSAQTTSMASSLLGASLAGGCPPNLPFFSGMMPEHRLNSITTLRLKAKEQMEIFKESCFNR